MGMFDSLYDEHGDEWQTKAYHCNLDRYETGAVMPPIVGVPDDYQVEVLGGGPREFLDAFATVSAGVLVAVGVDRDPALARVNYSGHLITDCATETNETSQEASAMPIVDLTGHPEISATFHFLLSGVNDGSGDHSIPPSGADDAPNESKGAAPLAPAPLSATPEASHE